MGIADFARLAMDNHSFMCYIVDMDTYELLYVNEAARATFAPFSHDLVKGKTCYDFLHGKNDICEICNNSKMFEGCKIFSEIQNEKNGRYYSHLDTMLIVNGKKLKITYAYDTSEQKEEIEALNKKISIEETLIKCVQTLIEELDSHSAILKLLSIVCEFYDADRAYLFEVDQVLKTARNTYEWSVRPELATIDTNPVLSLEELAPILEAFEVDGEMTIADIYSDLEESSPLFKLLDETNSFSLQLVPIYTNGRLDYFMGVDNPRREVKDLTLLHSVIIFVSDDIKKHRVLKQLEHLSYTDVLTGLNNRNKYLERLEDIEPHKLNSLGYVHININALKRMNEMYGEQYGDSILKQVAQIASSYLKTDLFRISGDEFIGLCQNITKEKFDILVKKLRDENNRHNEFSFAVGGVWQDKKIDIRQGLTQASDIMYSEKQNYYKGQQVTNRVQSRLNPVEILLKEIQSNAFTIYLQPKIDLSTGAISSAEALVRKFNTDGKMVPPDRFIPIYENENTIRHLDFFVLEEVCQLLQKLIAENNALPIAVNFSRVTCLSYDVIDEVVKMCAKYKVPHHLVKIELTESIDKMDFEFYHAKISHLNELGFDISLDDFGAKHSNLLMLTMAEFSEVKIDKGLIDHITTSAENRTVVRNVIKMVKELDKSSCVAEGIESEDQVALLKDLGCTYGQGYYFFKPMPVDDFLKIYKKEEVHFETGVKVIGASTRQNFNVNYDELYSALDAMPLCMNLWNHKRENVMCNEQAVKMFGLKNKNEYLERFFELSPEKQPDGRSSGEAALAYINEARNTGYVVFNWMHCKVDGESIPCEITLVRLNVKSEDGDFLVAGYSRDLRAQLAHNDESNYSYEYFFNEVTNRTLFNVVSQIAAEFFWAYNNKTKQIQFFGKGRDILNLPSTKMDFPREIIERNIATEAYLPEFMEFVRAMEEERYHPIEVEFNLPNGDVRFFRIDYRIIFDDNKNALFCIGKTADIHDRIMAQTGKMC